MTDLETYTEMLRRAGVESTQGPAPAEHYENNVEKIYIATANRDGFGSYSAVIAEFGQAGNLLELYSSGCAWDCDGCRT